MKSAKTAFGLITLLVANAASAQVAQTTPVAQSASEGSESAATTKAGPTTSPLPEAGIPIEHELLEPVPPPANIVNDWRQALDLVKTRSPSLLQAHAQIEVARGQSRMALAGALPKLTGTAEYQQHLITKEGIGFDGQPTTLPLPVRSARVGATLILPVLTARNWYDYATSRDQIERAKLQAEDTERLIIGGLAEALVGVITAERLSEVTRVNLEAALSTLELNKRRARLGSGNAVDVLRAQQEVTSSKSQVIEANETLRRSREALGRALGYSDAWGVTPELKLDQLRADARSTCERSEEIDDRADVRAAAAGAAIAERNVNSVMYGFLPTIDVTSTISYRTQVQFSQALNTNWIIGAVLTWHLYDGGLKYGERRQNKGLAEVSRQTEMDTKLTAQLEVTQATRGVHVARQSLEVAMESRQIADDNAALAKTKFINGTGTSFDMVDTQRTARQTKIDVTVKEFELLRAEIIAFLSLATCKI